MKIFLTLVFLLSAVCSVQADGYYYNNQYKNRKSVFVVKSGSKQYLLGIQPSSKPVVRSFGYHDNGYNNRYYRNQNYRRSYHPKTQYRDYGYQNNGYRNNGYRNNGYQYQYRNNGYKYRKNYYQPRYYYSNGSCK